MVFLDVRFPWRLDKSSTNLDFQKLTDWFCDICLDSALPQDRTQAHTDVSQGQDHAA